MSNPILKEGEFKQTNPLRVIASGIPSIQPENKYSNVVTVTTGKDIPEVLQPNTLYEVKNDIQLLYPIEWGDGAAITSNNRLGVRIFYDYDNTIFNGIDASGLLKDIQIYAPKATLFNLSNTKADKKLFIEGIQSAVLGSIGTIIGYQVKVIDLVEIQSEQGLILGGGGSLVTSITRAFLVSENPEYVAIDQGVSTNNLINYDRLIVKAPLGAVGIKGLSNSGNVVENGVATVKDCQFVGGMRKALEGISENDSAYTFKGNRGAGIRDTVVFCKLVYDYHTPLPLTSGILPEYFPVDVIGASRWVVDKDESGWYLMYTGIDPIKVSVRGYVCVRTQGGSPVEVVVHEQGNPTFKRGSKGVNCPLYIEDAVDVKYGKRISLEMRCPSEGIILERLQIIISEIN